MGPSIDLKITKSPIGLYQVFGHKDYDIRVLGLRNGLYYVTPIAATLGILVMAQRAGWGQITLHGLVSQKALDCCNTFGNFLGAGSLDDVLTANDCELINDLKADYSYSLENDACRRINIYIGKLMHSGKKMWFVSRYEKPITTQDCDDGLYVTLHDAVDVAFYDIQPKAGDVTIHGFYNDDTLPMIKKVFRIKNIKMAVSKDAKKMQLFD